jgi:myxalamid-type polyketide synthase MxaE and MxaD
MLRPKVDGTWLLHELTRDSQLDFFVLFSSTTALWGSRDLGHYAAANQFLDAFAFYRAQRGLPASTINWGTWEEMRVASAEDRAVVVGSGLNPMPTESALAVFGDLVGDPAPTQIVVAAVDWDVLKPIYEARRRRPFLSLVSGPRSSRPTGTTDAIPELAVKLAAAPRQLHRGIVVDFLRDEVARALGAGSPETVDIDQGLFEMGMDSLMSVELKGRVELAVGKRLPSTLTFNYPNVAALTDYLLSNVLVEDLDAAAADPASPVATPDAAGDEPARTGDVAAASMSEDALAAALASRLASLREDQGS